MKDTILIIDYAEGDWVSIVKNGKTIYGNHSISYKDLIKLLGDSQNYEITHEDFDGDEDEWNEKMKQYGGESV